MAIDGDSGQVNKLGSNLSSDKPIITALTLIVVLIIVISGAVVTITNPETLSFHEYIQEIAIVGGALGLGNGIGRGIESYGQAQASAQILTSAPPTPTPDESQDFG